MAFIKEESVSASIMAYYNPTANIWYIEQIFNFSCIEINIDQANKEK
jgi:hypothetical protein